MAFTSYGNKVYASIKDLPQYTSINNGDKVIVWNESREGAATIDYTDFKIDLEHTTFGTAINELLSFTGSVESFISTVNIDIENINNKINTLEGKTEKLDSRIKVLEYMVGIICGINMADDTRKSFIDNDSAIAQYNTLLTKVQGLIPANSISDVIGQAKFKFNAQPVGAAAATDATSISTGDIINSYKSIAPTIETTTTDSAGRVTQIQRSSISYN
jgi:hypothetical protein